MHRHAGSSIAGQREYVIKHALTREVAYASLLKAKRGPLHAGFAQWLERNGTGEDEHAPLLAHHYAEAVRPEDLDLAWPGRGRAGRSACAARRSGGRGGPRSWPSAATRSTRAWPCSTGPSASKAARGSRPGSGSGSAWPAPSSTTERVSGRPCSKRWTSAAPRPRCTPTSPCNRCCGAGCGSSSRTGPSSKAGSSRPWNSPRKTPSPRRTRSPRWQSATKTNPPPARPWRSPNAWETSSFAAWHWPLSPTQLSRPRTSTGPAP